jgi:PKD repeat protein
VTSSPSSLSITAGGANGTDTITVSSAAYTDTVTLVAQVDPAVTGGLQISFSGGSNVNSISLTAIVLPGPALTRTATLNVKLPAGASGPFYITIQASGGTSPPIDQKTVSIQVNPPALTTASLSPAIAPEATTPATLIATTTGGLAPFSYLWHFGDGTADQTTSTNSVSHTYAAAGANNAQVTVTDAKSTVIASSVTTVTVAPILSAATFTFTKTGLSATFTATTTGGVAPYTYVWSFGDGTSPTTTTTNTVTHTFAIAGTYTVGVKVTDANGVTVNAPTQAVTVP